MNRNDTQWQVLEDCLVFDEKLLRDVLASEPSVSPKQRQMLSYVDAGSQLFRAALQQCMQKITHPTPALVHYSIQHQLRHATDIPTMRSLLKSVTSTSQSLKPKRIMSVTKALLEEALPPKDWLTYDPNDELPERTNIPYGIVRHIVQNVFNKVWQPEMPLQSLRRNLMNAIGEHGADYASDIITAWFPQDERCLFSSHALAGAAALEISRSIPSSDKPQTMRECERQLRSALPTLEA